MADQTLLLKRQEAAALLGIGATTFSAWVAAGILPLPLAGTKMWSRVQLERAAAGLPFVPSETASTPEPEVDYWAQYKLENPSNRSGKR